MIFEDFIRRGDVKKISPDRELAKSLIKIAKLRIKNLRAQQPTEENSFELVEKTYEIIKELIDALIALKGYKSYSHEACISFLKKYYSAQVPLTYVNKINRYRIIRNDIVYRGLLTTKEEGEQALVNLKFISEILFKILKHEGEL